MIKNVAVITRGMGLELLRLESVYKNTAAEDFYRRVGFELVRYCSKTIKWEAKVEDLLGRLSEGQLGGLMRLLDEDNQVDKVDPNAAALELEAEEEATGWFDYRDEAAKGPELAQEDSDEEEEKEEEEEEEE